MPKAGKPCASTSETKETGDGASMGVEWTRQPAESNPTPATASEEHTKLHAEMASSHRALRRSPISKGANDAPDLSSFLGSADDQCPICLDTMPPLTWQKLERARSPCCGMYMCPDCSKKPHNQKKCPGCRCKLATTDEEEFQCYLKNANKSLTGKQGPLVRRRTADAQYRLALKYLLGEGTQKDLTEATRWFQAAAEQGHPWAMDECGKCFEDGEGVAQDFSKAKSWYERSIALQQPQGYYRLGNMYFKARGVPQNAKEGFRLMHIAAKMGYGDAQWYLAWAYRKGVGVDKNSDEDLKWRLRCAEQGDLDAQYSLGWDYYTGTGVNKNLDEALKWCVCSAEQGVARAMALVAQIMLEIAHHEHGTAHTPGASPIPRAAYWAKKAAKLGNENAVGLVQQIRSKESSHCAACGKEGAETKLRRCRKCKVTHYCSRECQVRHWNQGHEIDCVLQDP